MDHLVPLEEVVYDWLMKTDIDTSDIFETAVICPNKSADSSSEPGNARKLDLHAPFRELEAHVSRRHQRFKHQEERESQKEDTAIQGKTNDVVGVERFTVPLECQEPRRSKCPPSLGDTTTTRDTLSSNDTKDSSPYLFLWSDKPQRTYERRARRRTKADKYKLKQGKRPNDKPSEPQEKKRRKNKHDLKSGLTLLHAYKANNVVPDRLTLKPSKAGLFIRGRASSAQKRKGVRDLPFSEVRFLNHKIDKNSDETLEVERVNHSKRKTAVDRDKEQSRFFSTQALVHENSKRREPVRPSHHLIDRIDRSSSPRKNTRLPVLARASSDLGRSNEPYVVVGQLLRRKEHVVEHFGPAHIPSSSQRRALKARPTSFSSRTASPIPRQQADGLYRVKVSNGVPKHKSNEIHPDTCPGADSAAPLADAGSVFADPNGLVGEPSRVNPSHDLKPPSATLLQDSLANLRPDSQAEFNADVERLLAKWNARAKIPSNCGVSEKSQDSPYPNQGNPEGAGKNLGSTLRPKTRGKRDASPLTQGTQNLALESRLKVDNAGQCPSRARAHEECRAGNHTAEMISQEYEKPTNLANTLIGPPLRSLNHLQSLECQTPAALYEGQLAQPQTRPSRILQRISLEAPKSPTPFYGLCASPSMASPRQRFPEHERTGPGDHFHRAPLDQYNAPSLHTEMAIYHHPLPTTSTLGLPPLPNADLNATDACGANPIGDHTTNAQYGEKLALSIPGGQYEVFGADACYNSCGIHGLSARNNSNGGEAISEAANAADLAGFWRPNLLY